MKIDLTVSKNASMFRRAWDEVVPTDTKVNITSIEESKQVWLEEFGCRMTSDTVGFYLAEFDNEEDYTAFLLRWV